MKWSTANVSSIIVFICRWLYCKMQSASDVISSLFWFKDDNDIDDEKEPLIIEQFVQNVEDFSSQYGSEISVSYTAFNLRGPPSNFPDYGDYPQAFVMVSNYD